MKRNYLSTFTLAFLLAIELGVALAAKTQMPPKKTSAGDSVAILLNDSAGPMTIEVQNKGEWTKLQIDAGKDASVAGDRIRVATLRDDKATITVDLPVQAGSKYRVAWNAKAGMWDFSPAQ
jgi:hypothetical protein